MRAGLQRLTEIVEVPVVHMALPDFDSCSAILDNLPAQRLNNESWPEYATDCKASFSIAHLDAAMLIKFYVKDDYFQSRQRPVNSAVNKDNCVEFFISFNEDAYYNIEFNSLGVGKMAYGAKRTKRHFMPVSTVKKIIAMTKLEQKGKSFDWEMVLYIPTEVFEFNEITSLNGLVCKANFYKCGDDLPKPHFLAWNPIQRLEPDFHVPEYFGKIVFK